MSGFKGIKAGLVKGRGRAIAAMGLSGLATLGMFGALTLTEPAVAPIADSLGPSAAIVAPPNPRQRINRRRRKRLPHHPRWLRAPSRPNRRVGKSLHR